MATSSGQGKLSARPNIEIHGRSRSGPWTCTLLRMYAPCEPEPPESALVRPARDPGPRRATATDAGTTVTFAWLATQLLPSPELAFTNEGGPRFGMRWQLTPLLYSFGVDRRVSPFR